MVERYAPDSYVAMAGNAILAYSLYVRSLSGDLDIASAELLAQHTGQPELSLESIGWLLPVLSRGIGPESKVDSLIRYLANKVEETAAAAHFSDSYDDGGYLLLHSSRRTDAVVLDALMTARPDSDLIP